MKPVILVTLGLFLCIGYPAFAAEGSHDIPVVREDECLVAIDQVDTGLRLINYQNFLETFWSRELREAEEENFPYLNREHLEKRIAEARTKTQDYWIWRRGSGLNEVLIEFQNFETGEIILKPVKLRSGMETSVDHIWPKEQQWNQVTIEWEKETNAISVQWFYASISEEATPTFVGQEFRRLGTMTCGQNSNANQAEDNALGKADEVGPPLTAVEKNALHIAVQKCWNVGSLSAEALQTVVVVAFEMNKQARLVTNSIRMLSSSGGPDSAANQAFEAARHAIIRCGSRGYELPESKYDRWRYIELTFDPEQMRIK